MTNRNDIEIVRGTTNNFEIALKDAEGNPYTLSSGEKLIFGVKSNTNNSEYDFSKEITSADYVFGRYAFSVSPSDTEDLPYGTYFYDIGLQSSGNYYNAVRCSKFVIVPNITERTV